jgi:hypothetical protein
VAKAKRSVLNAEELPFIDGLLEESHLFQQLMRTPEAVPAMQAFLAAGGQTREGELRVGELNGEL